MPTIGTFMQLLPKGFSPRPTARPTAPCSSVVEGTAAVTPHRRPDPFAWGPRDVFVVPTWLRHHHEADGDAVLFSFSDRPVQDKLGLWREMRGNQGNGKGA